MQQINFKTVCPLPWVHFSAHLDSTMRICCNTDHSGFIFNNEGNTVKLNEITSVEEYFNLNSYKEIRREMLNGEKPQICKKCYQIEDSGGRSVRQSYLGGYMSDPVFLESLDKTSIDGLIDPRVRSLDFSLSNNCNLKCIMCSPDASYIIKKDFEKLGIPYNEEFTKGAKENWTDSSKVIKLLPKIVPDLREFLVTGGEPFLNKTHIDILKAIIKSGYAHEIRLAYHTNCTVKNDELFELWNSFRQVSVHFSIDAYGELDEYIRNKTVWDKVIENVEIMLNHEKVVAEVHTCVQVLNIMNLTDLYDWMKKFKTKMPTLPFHIWMDNPKWLHIDILPINLKKLALLKITNYFCNEAENLNNEHYNAMAQQIISYLKRSISTPQDIQNFDLFKKRLKEFELIRKSPPIETLVPEYAAIFTK